MTTKLKIGQRIGVYNVKLNVFDLGAVKVGGTYVGRPRRASDAVFLKTFVDYSPDGFTCMFQYEVKKVGVFIIRELKTNTDPITII